MDARKPRRKRSIIDKKKWQNMENLKHDVIAKALKELNGGLHLYFVFILTNGQGEFYFLLLTHKTRHVPSLGEEEDKDIFCVFTSHDFYFNALINP